MKNFRETEKYIHLNHMERVAFINDVAKCISKWTYAHLFAECIDKTFFNPNKTITNIDEQAFEQLVSRFEQFLKRNKTRDYGLIIHDNNQNVEEKHTKLMKKFYKTGTLWTNVECIIETPLFVNSQFTSMVQIADVCGFAIRRYLEKGEDQLFNLVYRIADIFADKVVGVRHFTQKGCTCLICRSHRR